MAFEAKSNSKNIAVFCDFDGTISTKDVGDELFKDFGSFQPYNQYLREGKIGIKEYWVSLCKSLPYGINEEKLAAYSRRFDIDTYFPEFIHYCNAQSISFAVVSDGFEEYIRPILAHFSLGDIKLYCNNLVFDTQAEPFFRAESESCECNVTSCKRNTMLVNSAPDDIIVYIGDGYSDHCAASHSDIVFAKKELAAFCNTKKIPHYTFHTFFDILRVFKKEFEGNYFKKRRQAELLRKKAFEIE